VQIDEQNASSADSGQERTPPVLDAARGNAEMQPAGDRHSRLFTAALVIGLVLCVVVALSARDFVNGAHRDVASEISSLANGTDRVTAIAWAAEQSALLFVGTQLGKLYRVDGSDRARALPEVARGPIVSIYPVAGYRATPRTVWLDPGSSEASTPYRAGESPTLSGLAALAGSALRAIDDTRSQKEIPSGDKATSQLAAPNFSPGIDSRLNGSLITAVGSIRISEPPPEVVSNVSDATILGYRDGSLRVINNRDQSLIWALRPDGGSADATPMSGTSSRSVIAIATRRVFVSIGGLADRRSLVSGTALFATATANGEVRVVRASDSGISRGGVQRILMTAGIQRILMAADGPPADVPPKTLATGEVSIRPGKDGLLLSEDGRILMMYGSGGLVVANLTENASSEMARSFWRFKPEALAAKRSPLGERGAAVRNLQEALMSNGFEPGPIDGVLGPSAQAALENYKKTRSISDNSKALDNLLGESLGLRISAATLSPRGDLFAVAGNDGVIRVVALPADFRDLSRAEQLLIRGHGDVITHLAISTDGRYLASNGVDGRLWITDVNRARQLARWPLRGVPSGPAPPEMSLVPFEPLFPQSVEPGLFVALSANDTLVAAQAEIARATAAGFKDLGIYQWGGKYNSVARYPDKEAQLAGLLQLRNLPRWSRVAYPDFLSRRCPSPAEEQGLTRCDAHSSPAAVPCEEEKNVRSRSGTTSTSIVFSNGSSHGVRIYWIDYGGARKFYGKLENGQSLNFQTYITHPWLVADLEDKCLGIYMPTATKLEVAVR
jgi:hypothetical protein